MAHVFKCVYCLQQFDRDKVPYVQVRSRRYAHKSCAEGGQPPPKIVYKKKDGKLVKEEVTVEKDPVAIEKEKLNAYLYNLYKGDYDYARTNLLIESYIKKYGYTYSGIRKTLSYFYEVQENPVDTETISSRSIGIVPYVYDEAKRYYYDIAAVNENNAKKNIQDYIPKDVIIKIQKPQRDIKKRKDFSFLDEDN